MINLKKKFRDLISFEVREKIGDILLKTFEKLGIFEFFRMFTKKHMLILLYHGISKKNFTFNHKTYLPKSTFIKQIAYLRRKRYKFINLTEWVNIVKTQKKINHRYAILTFDDGYKNIVEQAYPIMKTYGAKGCLYVVSSIVGNAQLLWFDYLKLLVRNHNNSKFKFKYKSQEIVYLLDSRRNITKTYSDIKAKLRTLSVKEFISHLKQFNLSNDLKSFQIIPKDYLIVNWEDINCLDKNILEIGNHTKTHFNLNILKNEEEFHEELYKSKEKIEKEIGYTVDHFCYPRGIYNDTIIEYAKIYGYLTGVTIEDGFNSLKTDLFHLKRLKIKNNFREFKYKISGLYYFVKNQISKYF